MKDIRLQFKLIQNEFLYASFLIYYFCRFSFIDYTVVERIFILVPSFLYFFVLSPVN